MFLKSFVCWQKAGVKTAMSIRKTGSSFSIQAQWRVWLNGGSSDISGVPLSPGHEGTRLNEQLLQIARIRVNGHPGQR